MQNTLHCGQNHLYGIGLIESVFDINEIRDIQLIENLLHIILAGISTDEDNKVLPLSLLALLNFQI